MRIPRLFPAALLALAAPLLSGCNLIPTLQSRIVQLATTASTAATFHATGVINVYSDSKTINLRDSVNVAKVLSDAGIDVSDVTSITLSGVTYRITVADPTAGRQITNASVKVQRQGGAQASLIDNFSANADATTGPITPTLNSAGVAQLNSLLADILTELKGGAAANEIITYEVDGNSVPADVSSDFRYEIRITISIVGNVKTQILG